MKISEVLEILQQVDNKLDEFGEPFQMPTRQVLQKLIGTLVKAPGDAELGFTKGG